MTIEKRGIAAISGASALRMTPVIPDLDLGIIAASNSAGPGAVTAQQAVGAALDVYAVPASSGG